MARPRAPSRTELTLLLRPTAAIEATPSKGPSECAFFVRTMAFSTFLLDFFWELAAALLRSGRMLLPAGGGVSQLGHRKPIVNAAGARYSRATFSAKGAPSNARACKLR